MAPPRFSVFCLLTYGAEGAGTLLNYAIDGLILVEANQNEKLPLGEDY